MTEEVRKMMQPIDRKHGELLRHSSFSTLRDAERFIEWYDENRHHSAWDDTRFEQAQMLLNYKPAIAAALAEQGGGEK